MPEWFIYAALSAVFAALTTIFAKLGVKDIDSDFATFIRTIVVVFMLVLLLSVAKKWQPLSSLSPKNWLFLILSGIATGLSWLMYFKAMQAGKVYQVALVDKFKNTYVNVKIEKLETINSKELNANGETALGLNVKNLILRLAVIGVACVILVVMGNVLIYLFNPTINRAGDFSQYQIDFVTEITTIANLADILSYKNSGQELTIVSTNKAILDKLKQNQETLKGMHFVDLQDVPSLLERDAVLLVEEYGVTRYKKFEQSLQILRNLNRSILGVATFKL